MPEVPGVVTGTTGEGGDEHHHGTHRVQVSRRLQRHPALVIGRAVPQLHGGPGMGEFVDGYGKDENQNRDEKVYQVEL